MTGSILLLTSIVVADGIVACAVVFLGVIILDGLIGVEILLCAMNLALVGDHVIVVVDYVVTFSKYRFSTLDSIVAKT